MQYHLLEPHQVTTLDSYEDLNILKTVMESSTQLPSTSTAKNFEYEYEYWYWKMYSSTSTVKKFEYEYFYKFRKRNF